MHNKTIRKVGFIVGVFLNQSLFADTLTHSIDESVKVFSELQLKMAFVQGYCEGIFRLGESIKEPTIEISQRIQDCEAIQKYHTCLENKKLSQFQCEQASFLFYQPLSLFRLKSILNLH